MSHALYSARPKTGPFSARTAGPLDGAAVIEDLPQPRLKHDHGRDAA